LFENIKENSKLLFISFVSPGRKYFEENRETLKFSNDIIRITFEQENQFLNTVRNAMENIEMENPKAKSFLTNKKKSSKTLNITFYPTLELEVTKEIISQIMSHRNTIKSTTPFFFP